ncbi:MAG: hypothetical protein H6519_04080 [Microthrixaceae bacterium]|nr:hypothetical protein [Microthrixaceae bacterium]
MATILENPAEELSFYLGEDAAEERQAAVSVKTGAPDVRVVRRVTSTR